MSLLKFLQVLSFVTFILAQDVTDEKPFFRVVAPQYLCDDPSKSTSNQSDSTNKLTVSLQTREGQRLRYKISIDFQLLDGFKNQRHTLSIWKNVRELQGKFAIKSISDEISLKNQIEIDARELTPQVIYTFKVIGYDENNKASDEQNFTITYKGDSQLQAVNSNVGEGVSLLLFGPETFYSDLEFIAAADVIFCDPINDFYFEWKINGITTEGFSDEYLSMKGSVLKLPPGVLDEDKSYEIVVSIFNSKALQMAKISQPVNVLARDTNIQNIPAECNVGVNREVPFTTALSRNPMSQNINVKWTCSISESECSNVFINSSSSLRVSAMFPNEGKYTLKTDVDVKGATKASETSVLADPKVIPHVEIKYFPPQPISATESTEIVATIMDLVPKCVAFWSIVADDNFSGPKDESMINVGLISIKDYEEHFLQELVDYDNNTLSKDITLNIPANSLHFDSIYKFRLNILCPEPITDLANPSKRTNVTTFYDIIFETNGPPQALPLLVEPLNGIPMKDEFTFKTGAAKEQQSDYPLKYTFSYQVGDLIINIGQFYEFQVARTQLPFAEEILTFLQVTDNNNASVYVKGPTVKANIPHNFTQSEIDFKLAEVQGTLKRSEYSKTLNSAVVLLLTTRQYSSPEDAKDYEKQVFEMLKSELEDLKSTTDTSFVRSQNVVEFMKMVNNLVSVMTVFDESFVEKILSLTESQARRARRMVLSNSLRNKNIMSHDPDYIKNVLSLSDILISSSNMETVQREKKKYVEKVRQFILSLCQDPNLNTHVIQSRFVTFDVSKIYTRQLFMQPQKFSSDSASVMFSFNPTLPYKFVCIGKVKYLTDMFSDSTKANVNDVVYETRILDDDQNGQKMAVRSDNVGEFVVMEMTVKNGNAKEQTCFTWLENRWSSKECEAQAVNQTRIVCKCKTAGDSAIVKYQKSSAIVLDTTTKSTGGQTTKTPIESFKTTTKRVSPKDTETLATTPMTKTNPTTQLISTVATSVTTLTKNEAETSTLKSSSTAVEIVPTVASTKPTATQEVFTTASKQTETTQKTVAAEKVTVSTPSKNVNEEASTEQIGEKIKEQTTTTAKTTIVTKESHEKTNSTSANVVEANFGLNIWFVLGMLCLFFGAILILFLVHKCRRFKESNISLPMRQPSTSIKYAKYHDEFTMRG